MAIIRTRSVPQPRSSAEGAWDRGKSQLTVELLGRKSVSVGFSISYSDDSYHVSNDCQKRGRLRSEWWPASVGISGRFQSG